MAITTYNARVELAKYIISKINTMYLVIGRPDAWSNEQAPPEPTENTTKLDDTIGYKKITRAVLVRPEKDSDSNRETVSYGNKSWTVIDEEEAISEGAKWVYFESKVVGDELPTGTYRQAGIAIDVEPKTGNGKQALLPGDLESAGTLMFYDNKQFQNRTEQVTTTERMIVEF